jgi:hypothetical protein
MLTALVKGYYVAMAVHDGAEACRLMNPTLAAAIPEDYGAGAGPPYAHGTTCALVMSKIFRHVYQGRAPGAVRVEKITGYLLFEREGVVRTRSVLYDDGEITVSRPNAASSWRIGSLIERKAP